MLGLRMLSGRVRRICERVDELRAAKQRSSELRVESDELVGEV